MKGNIKLTIETRDEFHDFPITTTWSWERDNTIESIEEWIDLFNMILASQGFHSSAQVGIKHEDEEYGTEGE